jgi:hypothetical protein
MNIVIKSSILLAVSLSLSTAYAKLPAPSDEAKAKAAEASAKTAWNDKVGAYKLCLWQDKVAARYYSDAKRANKETKPAVATTACADPGAFVYPPPVAAVAAASAPAAGTAPAASPAPVVAVAPKK